MRRVLATPGRPLDSDTRAFFEPRFAHDFTRVPSVGPQKLAVGEVGDAFEQEADNWGAAASAAVAPAPRRPGAGGTAGEAPAPRSLAAIRVHDDAEAAESARAVTARAYTVGSHIVFNHGEYAPHTEAGRRLLAHELAHVGQQGGDAGRVQRKMTVADAGKDAPNQPAGRDPALPVLTNAQLAQTWIDTLCPGGGWKIDSASGVLSSPNREAFCRDEMKRTSFRRSGKPVSCKCLCDITADGAPDVHLHTGDSFTAPGEEAGKTETINVSGTEDRGQGMTLGPRGARTETHIGVSGREHDKIEGAAATSPLSGSGRSQILRDPPWLIFAHELCGHVMTEHAFDTFFASRHTQTPKGKESAVDVENRIRREHSTKRNSLGIRKGEAGVEPIDAPGMIDSAFSSYYDIKKGETLKSIARRCGIAEANILDQIFRGEGERHHSVDEEPDSFVIIRNVFYHEVIKDETLWEIAKMWEIPLSSLRRANPGLPPDTLLPIGKRLLIPAS
ncbi:MAG TPA: DUF4157 domain-containing protein [Thermoanaerobaculia bacterium]|nr:DUF4157 domain-containing protein [Thermoanaerobaculia bacterium]